MNVIVHEDISMQLALGGYGSLSQQLQVTLPIVVIQETRKSVVTTLDDMLGDAGEIKSWKSSHAFSMDRAFAQRHQAQEIKRVGFSLRRVEEVNLTPLLK